MNSKTCRRCKLTKAIKQFYYNKCTQRFAGTCIPCKSILNKIAYQKVPKKTDGTVSLRGEYKRQVKKTKVVCLKCGLDFRGSTGNRLCVSCTGVNENMDSRQYKVLGGSRLSKENSSFYL